MTEQHQADAPELERASEAILNVLPTVPEWLSKNRLHELLDTVQPPLGKGAIDLAIHDLTEKNDVVDELNRIRRIVHYDPA